MDREGIEDKVKTIIAELLNVEESLINDDSNWMNDFAADSLDAIEIIMEIEDAFDISISEEESNAAIDFRSVIDIVEDKIGQ